MNYSFLALHSFFVDIVFFLFRMFQIAHCKNKKSENIGVAQTDAK